MPACSHCGKTWPWTECIKLSFNFNRGWSCPACGVTQYANSQTRKRSALLSGVLPFIIIFTSTLFELSFPAVLVLALILFIITLIILPFTIRLSGKIEPLW
ncbi:TIGR04104 family putative zinc finger protein [Jeotgalibacillus proteolyticus]|uniref:TIGR04104 family putative zinc finger protein n=1 Tax=Jeotgalibacillus proteolyticus TaxID=2082395 RepID=UPI003CEB226F